MTSSRNASGSQHSTRETVLSDREWNTLPIIFRTNRGDMLLDYELMARHSSRFKGRKPRGNAAPLRFDLNQYDVISVTIVRDFLNDAEAFDPRVLVHSNGIVGELLELGRALHLDGFLALIQKQVAVDSNSPFDRVVGNLCVKQIMNSADDVATNSLNIAKANIKQVCESPQFSEISPSVLVEILDSCDLAVNSEVEVAIMAVKWLKDTKNRLIHAASLFQCIRMGRLLDEERAFIMHQVEKLPQGKQLLTILKVVIGDLDNWRVCVLNAHQMFARCGKLPNHLRDETLNVHSNFVDLEFFKNEKKLTSATSEAQIFSAVKLQPMRLSSRVERRAMREAQQKRDHLETSRILRKPSPSRKPKSG
ncbi:BACK domain-containing protein [Aphelenchoides besseyi]|nr:BACK domain-containing protein [Aphelenchoides besseyi]